MVDECACKVMKPLLLASITLLTVLGAYAKKPNIIFILCDDLGYGDVHCMAPETSKIKTPCADQLAREGMIFSDAHSGSCLLYTSPSPRDA